MTDTCMMFVFFGVKLIICVQANNFSLHVYHKVLLIENCETVLANNISFSACLEDVHSHEKEIIGAWPSDLRLYIGNTSTCSTITVLLMH